MSSPTNTSSAKLSSSRATSVGRQWMAVSASFFCPGFGQFVLGRWIRGLLMLAMFVVGVLMVGSTVILAFMPYIQEIKDNLGNGDPSGGGLTGNFAVFRFVGVGGGGFVLSIASWLWSLVDAWFLVQRPGPEPGSGEVADTPKPARAAAVASSTSPESAAVATSDTGATADAPSPGDAPASTPGADSSSG